MTESVRDRVLATAASYPHFVVGGGKAVLDGSRVIFPQGPEIQSWGELESESRVSRTTQ